LPPELADKALLISRSDARIVWFSRDTSLKELAAKLTPDTVSPETAGSVQYLISLDGSLEQLERVATLLEVMGLAT
jgi:hypothetical protein